MASLSNAPPNSVDNGKSFLSVYTFKIDELEAKADLNSTLEFSGKSVLKIISPPFGGILVVFDEELKYFKEGKYETPLCI